MLKIVRLVSFSGGMDSATLLAAEHRIAQQSGNSVSAVGFFYGSKHNQHELKKAYEFAKHLGVPYQVLDLTKISEYLQSNLLLTGPAIPEGHYQASNMSQTVVPGRNTIFLSILLGIAQSHRVPIISLGAHSGDHVIYPDCRVEYLDAMRNAISLASEGSVVLRTPFQDLDKERILRLSYFGSGDGPNQLPNSEVEGTGMENMEPLAVPYELTRTCYKDQPVACGKCGSCRERLEAFANLGIEDPAEYEYRGPYEE